MSIRLFGHYVSFPLLVLLLAELLIHVGAVYLGGTLRFLDSDFQLLAADGSAIHVFPRALLYAAVMMGVMTALGLYGSQLHVDDREYQVRFLASFPAAAVVMAILFYAIPESVLGRGLMALSLAFSFLGSHAARSMFLRVIDHEALKRRVLVLGSGSRALEVEALLLRLGRRARFHLVGFVRCGDSQPQTVRSMVVGDCGALRELVR
jgi:hypothetical protein